MTIMVEDPSNDEQQKLKQGVAEGAKFKFRRFFRKLIRRRQVLMFWFNVASWLYRLIRFMISLF